MLQRLREIGLRLILRDIRLELRSFQRLRCNVLTWETPQICQSSLVEDIHAFPPQRSKDRLCILDTGITGIATEIISDCSIRPDIERHDFLIAFFLSLFLVNHS